MASRARKTVRITHGFMELVETYELPDGTDTTTEPSSDTETTEGYSDTDPSDVEDSDEYITSDEEGEDVSVQLTKEETCEKLENLLDSFEKLYQDTYATLKKPVDWQRLSTKSKVAELLQLVKSWYAQLKDDRQFPRKYRMEYRRKAAERMVKVGLVHPLCDGVVKCFEVLECNEDNGNVRSLLDTMLLILINFSDGNPSVCKAIRMHKMVLCTLVTEMEAARVRLVNDSSRTGDERRVVDCLNIIHKVALEEENVPHLQQIPSLIDVLSRFIAWDNEVWKFFAVLALACVVSDAQASKLSATSDMILVLLRCVTEALNNDGHEVTVRGFATVKLMELLKAVTQLSKNNSNSRLLVQKGALPVLKQGLVDCKHQGEKKACMESLWWLSFNNTNQEDMMKDTELLDFVIEVCHDHSDPCHSAAEGMLFQLREHLQKHPRKEYNDVGKRLQKGSETQQAASGHVMLSYQKADREVVQMVCDYLKDNGIPVWMDVYNIADSKKTISQSMADGVEESVVFLMFLSEGYMRSAFCRQEAEYAFEEKKHIIPVKLHKGFEPRGWLGFIGAGKFFFDLSDKNMYEKKMPDLLKNIRKAFNAADKN